MRGRVGGAAPAPGGGAVRAVGVGGSSKIFQLIQDTVTQPIAVNRVVMTCLTIFSVQRYDSEELPARPGDRH